MLRALVVLLLLANALVLAWSLGMLDGLLGRRPNAEREPERLQRQVNPELVKLLPPPGAQGASASAPAATAASQPTSAASSPLVAVAAGGAGSAGTAVCLEAGPLPASVLAGAEKALLAAGVAAGSWTTTAAAPKGVFLIYMGRYEDDETLQRKLDELKRRRIEAHPVRQPELQPGIEVARFDEKDEADEALARLSQRGLRTARVLTLVAPQPQQMLRLAAVEATRAEALAALKLAPAVDGFKPCAPTPAARPMQAGAQASAGAAAMPAVLGSAARPAAARVRSAASGDSPGGPTGGAGGASTAADGNRAGSGAGSGASAAGRANGGVAAGSAATAP